MNEYTLKIGRNIDECEKMEVACNNWNYPYVPKTTAQLTFIEGEGFHVRLTSFEANPFTRYIKPNEPVYTDSCMEIFIKVFPEKSDIYINCESNSNGAYICGAGNGRPGRTDIIQFEKEYQPKITVTKEEDRWTVDMILGTKLLEKIYGTSELKSGSYILCNFYKCQEDSDKPHFVSWSKIVHEVPDFHRPEYFGRIDII